MNWMAVYTTPRSELKTAERLIEKGIETFCPSQVVFRQWSDRKKKVRVPLFSSYVFVRCDETTRIQVLETPGVVRFVFYLKKPAVIYDKEIDIIKQLLSLDAELEVEAMSLEEGKKYRLENGAFDGQEAILLHRSGNKITLYIAELNFKITTNSNSLELTELKG